MTYMNVEYLDFLNLFNLSNYILV